MFLKTFQHTKDKQVYLDPSGTHMKEIMSGDDVTRQSADFITITGR